MNRGDVGTGCLSCGAVAVVVQAPSSPSAARSHAGLNKATGMVSAAAPVLVEADPSQQPPAFATLHLGLDVASSALKKRNKCYITHS